MSNNEFQSLKEFLIENYFPYVQAPEKIWIQRDGNMLFISQMETSHIEACCKRIKKDIKDIELKPDEIRYELVEKMNKKYNELKIELNKRIKNI